MHSKRILDFVTAGLGLILVSPLCFLIAVAIKLDSPGAVFYRGTRIGKDGKKFSILKFRTMICDAAARGAGITTRDDPRVTRVGRILRRTKLDELPQLWNVLRGEMSLVGPRPEDPRYLEYYTPAQRAVLTVPPGITSAASLAFRNEEVLLQGINWERTYTEIVLPQKLEIELGYLQRRSLWSDVTIIGKTFLTVLQKESGGYVT